ncbi:hypothetical protein [Paenibacillus arenilitoris]|uniref:Uncharacterized protein n=1 Tax=Paenibacillus arenilitoris TaxID=2772299 RepID=A0A927CQD4_9BACL|nr:hypothetical protein [Paenibacillus arenilitoris]MBD2871162.1 hypothetical protein [Paenibacillus arenilitoris]
MIFTLTILFPAILFSVLVLGLTDSVQAGTVMLVSSSVLIVAVIGYELYYRPPRRSGKRGSIPPTLSDLYRELYANDRDNDRG